MRPVVRDMEKYHRSRWKTMHAPHLIRLTFEDQMAMLSLDHGISTYWAKDFQIVIYVFACKPLLHYYTLFTYLLYCIYDCWSTVLFYHGWLKQCFIYFSV